MPRKRNNISFDACEASQADLEALENMPVMPRRKAKAARKSAVPRDELGRFTNPKVKRAT